MFVPGSLPFCCDPAVSKHPFFFLTLQRATFPSPRPPFGLPPFAFRSYERSFGLLFFLLQLSRLNPYFLSLRFLFSVFFSLGCRSVLVFFPWYGRFSPNLSVRVLLSPGRRVPPSSSFARLESFFFDRVTMDGCPFFFPNFFSPLFPHPWLLLSALA